VRLAAGGEIAQPLEAPGAAERLRMVIALTASGAKATSSTRGMLRTQRTSPYYPAWCSDAPALYDQAVAGLLAGDFERLGEAMEHSTLMMHASMLAARPPLLYLNGATLDVIACVQELRASGSFAFFTMDAGPHVKVLTSVDEQDAVALRLSSVPGVLRVIRAQPGPGAHLVESA
jgi:diphosphomevalonate decarboxylase